MTPTGGAAFATAVRVIHRIHGDAAYGGTDTTPALGACLAERAQVVFGVAHLAQGRAAVGWDLAYLARTQPQCGVLAFPRHQLHRRAGAARQLRAFARLHLYAVQGAAHRNVADRQAVARLDRRIRAG